MTTNESDWESTTEAELIRGSVVGIRAAMDRLREHFDHIEYHLDDGEIVGTWYEFINATSADFAHFTASMGRLEVAERLGAEAFGLARVVQLYQEEPSDCDDCLTVNEAVKEHESAAISTVNVAMAREFPGLDFTLEQLHGPGHLTIMWSGGPEPAEVDHVLDPLIRESGFPRMRFGFKREEQ